MASDREALIRRYQSNIRLGGRYFIFFGLWSVIRAIMEITMKKEIMEMIYSVADVSEEDALIFPYVIALILILIFIVVIGVHLFIGISAIRYSSGKSRNIIFLILSAFIIGYLLVNIPLDLFGEGSVRAPQIAAAVVDATMGFLLFDMIYSAVRINRLSKEAEE